MNLKTRLRENLALMFYLLLLVLFAFSLWVLQPELDEIFSQVGGSLSSILEAILIVSLILIFTKILIVIGHKLFTTTFKKYRMTEMDTQVMWQMASYVIWIVALILILLVFTRDSTGFGVSIGIVSAALVFILQRPLLNIAGWMVIIFKQPYAVGERIEVVGKKGFVVEINLMYTQLREFGALEGAQSAYTGKYFSFPNSFVLEHEVINYDKDTTYVWDEMRVSVTYESDHARAKTHILEAVEEVVGKQMRLTRKFIESKFEFESLKSRMISEPTVFMKLADSCVNFYAIYFVDLSVKGRTKSRIAEKVLEKFAQDRTVSIAYPHLQLVPHPGQQGRASSTDFLPVEQEPGAGYQTRLLTRSERPKDTGDAPSTKEAEGCEDSGPRKGVVLLPLSRTGYRKQLITFLAAFADSLDYELRVLNAVKMQRRKQRQVDMESITKMEKSFAEVTKDLKNVSMDIKIFYDPVQSILAAMADEKVKMVVIPWGSTIIPKALLSELLEKTATREAGSCDIVVVKKTPSPEKLERILVPVGFGENIVKFGQLLRNFAMCQNVEMVLLGVATRREEKLLMERRVEEFAENVLKKGMEEPERLRVSSKVVVRKLVADAIQEEGGNCQLIVLGATGRRQLKSYLFGSIPDIILKSGKQPVMVLQRGERE